MKATPLFREGGTAPVLWLCDGCDYGFTHRTQEQAERCCRCKWEACPLKATQGRTYCDAHDKDASALRDALEDRKESARFAKAKKVPECREAQGKMIYDPNERGSREGYFHDLDSLRDHYAGGDEPPPAYVWATTECHFRTDARNVIENALENANVDSDMFSFDGDSLQKVLDAWWEANGEPFYEIDYSTAIVLSTESEAT